MFEEVAASLGGLDALINNAGIAGPTGGVDEIDPADWRRCIDICLTGQFLCARRAVPMLKAAGGGSIVNMSSAAGRHGYAFRTPYSAAKFGRDRLHRRASPRSSGRTTSASTPSCPASSRDRAWKASSAPAPSSSASRYEEMTERYLEKVSLRRMVSPYDVAAMVAFLLSDAGSNISGQSLGVDGNVETL